jgi:hypothetical protein
MKFKGTLVALALAAALAGYVLLSERREQQRQAERAARERLLPVAPAEVVGLSFAHSGEQVVLEKRGQTWVLVRPVSAPCDPRLIAAFLDTLAAARIEQQVSRGDLARYGLDSPAAVAEFASQDGARRVLRFGRINPLQTLVYVVAEGTDRVALTTSSLLTFALTSDFGWRDKRMLDADPEAIARMQFHTLSAGSLAVRLDPRFGWFTEHARGWRADPVRARDLLLQLARLEAVGVSDENKAQLDRYGLGNRRLRAELEYGGGRKAGEVVFGLARGEGSYYAIVPDKPEVFRVDASVVDRFVEFTRDPWDRRLFPAFDPDAVARLEVSSPTDRFAIERRSRTDWVVTESQRLDSTFALDPGKMQSMLESLVALTITEFPPAQPDSSLYEPPELTVSLFGEAGSPLSGLRVGRKDPRGLLVFARGLGDRAAFLVSPATLIQLPFDLERLGVDEREAPAGAERG